VGRRAASEFAAGIGASYPPCVGRFDKPYVLGAESRLTAREVLIVAVVIVSLCTIVAIVLL